MAHSATIGITYYTNINEDYNFHDFCPYTYCFELPPAWPRYQNYGIFIIIEF